MTDLEKHVNQPGRAKLVKKVITFFTSLALPG